MKIFQAFLYLNVSVCSLFFVIWLFTSTSFFQFSASAEEPSPTKPVVQRPVVEEKSQNVIQPAKSNKSAPKGGANAPADPEAGTFPPSPPVNVGTNPVSSSPAGNTKNGEQAVQREGASVPESPPSPPVNVGTNPASSGPAGNTKNGEQAVQREGASVPESPPSPPVNVGTNPASSGPAGNTKNGEQAVQREGASVPESPPPPPPLPGDVSLKEKDEVGIRSSADKKDAFRSKAGSAELNELLKSAKDLQSEGTEGAGTKAAKDLIGINKKILEIYKLLSDYQYDPSNRRDPFKPIQIYEEEEVVKNETVIELPPTYPTGEYDLSEIKLVGIKWNSKLGPSKALFKTPDDTLHYLQKNDRIGRNWGVIYRLKEDEVVVLEPRKGMASNSEEDAYIPIIVRLDRWTDKDRKDNNNNNTELGRPRSPNPVSDRTGA